MEALATNCRAKSRNQHSDWSSRYGDRHRLVRIKNFPPSITPPKRVRINRRHDHFVLQWWDPAAKRNLCARENGDLVAAISRAREIESRLENFRSAGIGHQKLRHRDLITAFIADLRQRANAGEIDSRTVVRYESALTHYAAFAEQRAIESAFPAATLVNREFALKFSAFLAERRISPNGHPNTTTRKMSSTRYVEDVARAMFAWGADPERGHRLPSDFRNPFLGHRRQTMSAAPDPFGEPDVTIDMAVEALSACDSFQLPLFSLLICYGLRASEPCFLFRDFLVDDWLRVPCLPEIHYAPKGRRDKRLPILEPIANLLKSAEPQTGLLFVRREVFEGTLRPPLRNASLPDLKEEFDLRCRKQGTASNVDRLRIRDGLLRDAGGLKYDQIEHEFHRLTKPLKWPASATLKDFRHLFSTQMQNGGLPEYYRRYLMGHSPGRAAIVSYTHLNELREHYEAAAEKKLKPIIAAIQHRQIELALSQP